MHGPILYKRVLLIKYIEVKVAQSRLTLYKSLEFSTPEYWSGEPFPSPGDLPNEGIEPRSPALPADSLPTEPPGKQIVTHGKVLGPLLQTVLPVQCTYSFSLDLRLFFFCIKLRT